MKRITIIDCCQNDHDEIDEIKNYLVSRFENSDTKFDTVKLSELNIVRCTECRCCAQKKGDNPKKCFVHDEMDYVIDEIESSDSYILISDRSSIFKENKVYSKFSKRLVAYYYWPYGQTQSIPRKLNLNKKSIVINFNTGSYFVNKAFDTCKQNLKNSATAIGAKVLDALQVRPSKEGNFLSSYKHQLKLMTKKLLKA